MIDLRILGPLALLIDGRPVRLSPLLRVLLLCLLLGRQPVPARRLAELLWEGEPPAGWQATLRSHVYRLRQAIDGRTPGGRSDLLVTEKVGEAVCYALRIPPDCVDASRFHRLVTAGRKALGEGNFADAAGLLADALALWRGQPLADVAGRPFALAEIARLEGLYRAARTARIETEIALGRFREVIGELEGLLTRWPSDDGLRRLLVESLCRAERYGDAARACQAGIELALEQGLDLTGLQALQRGVLLAPGPPHGGSRADRAACDSGLPGRFHAQATARPRHGNSPSTRR
jgi:DNA-binding SARP family transcriptional activator